MRMRTYMQIKRCLTIALQKHGFAVQGWGFSKSCVSPQLCGRTTGSQHGVAETSVATKRVYDWGSTESLTSALVTIVVDFFR